MLEDWCGDRALDVDECRRAVGPDRRAAAAPRGARWVVVKFFREDLSMDVVEQIKTELTSAPVVLFMKGTPDFPQCGFSAQTVAALRAVGADFKHINIFEEPELREALKRYSNWPTYPQLYVNGELVGGCDIALEMYRSGELKKLMAEAGAVTA
jgi:monothiol glutaredoxin